MYGEEMRCTQCYWPGEYCSGVEHVNPCDNLADESPRNADGVDDAWLPADAEIVDTSRAGIASAVAEAARLLDAELPGPALAMLREICFRLPEHALGHAYLGIAWLQLGHVDIARLELERAVQLAPNSLVCRIKHAEFLLAQGAPEQALGEIDQALRLPSHDRQTRSRILGLRRECVRQANAHRRIAGPNEHPDSGSSWNGVGLE